MKNKCKFIILLTSQFRHIRAGYFPAALSITHSKRKTPYTALIAGSVIGFSILMITRFLSGAEQSGIFIGGALLNMAVFSAMLSYVLQSGSFLLLRINQPDLVRPYVSPMGKAGAWITIVIALVTIYYQLQDPSYRTAVFSAIVYLLVGLIYFALKGRHRLILSPEEEFAMSKT